ncbi:ribosome silencing factor [Saccharospirillum impatiens]|uniref:ribosome silencing factor n=1 Tax=Saccharospirillum impatiens TaxID=169438 RepID=UPI00042A6B1A|nr:ribosome silencing factor [Saccharospirillum impatiens]
MIDTNDRNAQPEGLTEAVIRALEDIKAQDIQIIDVHDKTALMDTLVVASGTSKRHVSAVVSSVAEDLKKQGFVVRAQEGSSDSDWVLIDLTDLVLHVMIPETRAYYDIERLWSGAGPMGAESEVEPD